MASNVSSTNSSYSYLQTAGGRYSGLVSGMDTESIVEKLMKAESAQMEKLQQQQQQYEWQRDAYREVNTKLQTFSDDLFKNYGLQSAFSAKTATVSDATKVSVTANAGAAGSLTVDYVTQLATSGTNFATLTTTGTALAQGSTMLSKLGINGGKFNFTTTKDGVTTSQSIDIATDETLASFAYKLKDKGADVSIKDGALTFIPTTTKVAFSDSASKSVMNQLNVTLNTDGTVNNSLPISFPSVAQGDTKLSELGITATQDYFNFSITTKDTNGNNVTTSKSVVYSKDDTLSTFVNKLKAEGVDSSFNDGKLSFGSSQVTVTDPNSKVLIRDNMKVALDGTGKAIGSSEITGTFSPTKTTTLSELGIAKGGTVTLGVLQKDGTMKSVNVDYTTDMTINSLVSKLNNSGVSAVFGNSQLSITANNTGSYSGGSIQVRGDTTKGAEALFNKLGFIGGSSEIGKIADGKDAVYSVNNIEMTSKSNTFSVSGYTLTVNNTFNTAKAVNSTEKVSISSNTNVDSMVDKVKKFVESYNDLVTSLNSQMKEKKNLNYPPLTDSQKAEMTDKQIEAWEKKAKAGTLRNDINISNFLSSSRSAVYQAVDGLSNTKYNTLYNIGITTTASYTDGGILQINETKLREALTNDSDSVMKLFTDSDSGIVTKLRDAAKSNISSIEEKAGKESSTNETFTIGKNLNELKTKIDDWKDRLKDIETRYWNQFSAMERAIQKANSQSSIFSQG